MLEILGSIELQIFILAVLVVLSAFFSGAETSMMSLSMAKVRSLVKQNRKGSEALLRLKEKPRKLIIAILIGNNLVNIAAASLATYIFTKVFGSVGIGIATGIMTLLILVFGEITPKTFATQNAVRMSLFMAKPIEVISIILSPFVRLFAALSKGMSKLLGTKKEKQISYEELKSVVTIGKEEGILSKEAEDVMHSVVEWEGTMVTSIMTPKVDIRMVSSKEKIKDAIDLIVKTRFSRYPVYEENEDKIIGILDVDDVLKCVKTNKLNTRIKRIIQPVFFIPESKKITDLLSEFADRKLPMAIVVDEYGDVSGMVTVDDILEELADDILLEKSGSEHIKKIGDREIQANGKANVDDINKILKVNLRNDKFNTVAGFIEHRLGRIPRKGEKIELDTVSLVVEDVTKQGIRSVSIRKKNI